MENYTFNSSKRRNNYWQICETIQENITIIIIQIGNINTVCKASSDMKKRWL